MVVRSARKAKGSGYLRRAEILEAAERIFVEEGYEGATIRKIAEEVGVSSTALYVHFRDKSEILVEICTNTFDRLHELTVAIAAESLDPVEKVRRMLLSYVEFGLANPSAYRLVYGPRPPSLSDEQRAAIEKVAWRPTGPFQAAIQEAAKAGHLKFSEHVSAELFWMGTHGLVELLLIRPSVPWADADELKRAMIDGLFHGAVRA
jgi:AcrR family transcriptional regulator